MEKYWYSDEINNFMKKSSAEIRDIIQQYGEGDVTRKQMDAWMEEIELLKKQLKSFQDARIIFEYKILNNGTRIDTVILYGDTIFILEFKCGSREKEPTKAINQVDGYFYQLYDFHLNSRNKKIVPIVITTKSSVKIEEINFKKSKHEVEHKIIITNGENLGEILKKYSTVNSSKEDWKSKWEESGYEPNLDIVNYTRCVYKNIENFKNNNDIYMGEVEQEINKIIKKTNKSRKKSICFITGVPGSGKTKIGLDITVKNIESSVFLTGNAPLQKLLSSIINDNKKDFDDKENKRNPGFFIQMYKYYKQKIEKANECESIIIFDEAQRAWNAKKENRTRKKEFYDGTYEYLKELGIEDL